MARKGDDQWSIDGVGLMTFFVASLGLIALLLTVGVVLNHPDSNPARPPASSTPEPRCGDAPDQAVADDIVSTKQDALYELARTLYEGLLAKDPADQCAADGLVRLAAAEKASEPEPTWAQQAEDAWAAWTDDYGSSLTDLLPVTAGLFVLLLVLARLLTGQIVTPRALGTTERHRQAVWLWGLVVAAGACLLVVVALSTSLDGHPWVSFVVLVAVIGLSLLLLDYRAAPIRLARSENPSLDRGHPRAWWLVLGVGVLEVTFMLALMIWPSTRFELSALTTCAALAVVGVVLVAVGRGLGQGVRVQATGAGGEVDEVLGRAVVAKLEQLGSHSPSGLRAAVGTDVTELPEEALTSVPSGAWASALFSVLRVVGRGSPWRAEISVDEGRAVVSLLRNGQPAAEGSLVIDQGRFPGVPAETAEAEKAPDQGAGDPAESELVTACAAHLLIKLSELHPQLRRGLCGAETWESVAYYEIARELRMKEDRSALLLDAAVDSSPRFLLARDLKLLRLPATTTGDRRVVAESFDALWSDFAPELGATIHGRDAIFPYLLAGVGPPHAGYEAIQLRMLFNRTVYWANVSLDARLDQHVTDAKTAWSASADSLLALRERTAALSRVDWLQDLLDLLRRPVAYVTHVLANAAEGWSDASIQELRQKLGASGYDLASREYAPQHRFDHYSLGCMFAEAGKLAEALRPLEVALTAPHMREYARNDPSLHGFRVRGEGAEPTVEQVRYKALVTPEPVSSYLDLSPFAPHAAVFKALGIGDLREFELVSEWELAAATKVHHALTRKWHRIAELYGFVLARLETEGRPAEQTALQLLQLLLVVGVPDTTTLARRMQDQSALYRQLVKESDHVRLWPTRQQTVDAWARAEDTSATS